MAAYGEVNGEIQVSIGSRGNKRNAGGRRIRSNDSEEKKKKKRSKEIKEGEEKNIKEVAVGGKRKVDEGSTKE